MRKYWKIVGELSWSHFMDLQFRLNKMEGINVTPVALQFPGKKHLRKATKHRSLTARIIQAPWFILILFNKNSLKGTHPAAPAPKRPWTLFLLGEFVFTLSTFTTVLEGSPVRWLILELSFLLRDRRITLLFYFRSIGQQCSPSQVVTVEVPDGWDGEHPKRKATYIDLKLHPQIGGEKFLGESDPQQWPKHSG